MVSRNRLGQAELLQEWVKAVQELRDISNKDLESVKTQQSSVDMFIEKVEQHIKKMEQHNKKMEQHNKKMKMEMGLLEDKMKRDDIRLDRLLELEEKRNEEKMKRDDIRLDSSLEPKEKSE